MGRPTKKQQQRKQRKSKLVVNETGRTEKRQTAKRVISDRAPNKHATQPVRKPSSKHEENINLLLASEEQEGFGRTSVTDTFRRMTPDQKKALAGAKEQARPTRGQFNGALGRLQMLAQVLQAPPKTILQQLEELGVPYQIVGNVPGDPRYDTVVIKMTDLREADQTVLSKGSLTQQLEQINREEGL